MAAFFPHPTDHRLVADPEGAGDAPDAHAILIGSDHLVLEALVVTLAFGLQNEGASTLQALGSLVPVLRVAILADGVTAAAPANVDDGRGKHRQPSGLISWQATASLSLPEFEFQQIHSDLNDEGVFLPSSVSDAREIILRAIVQRRGQNDFRSKLVGVYKVCCVTEEATIQVLEAAHIVPYKGGDTNHVQNGLLLRSDVHTLFDLKLLSINPEDYTVVVSPQLKMSSYGYLDGNPIRLPEDKHDRPSSEALAIHRNSCNF